MVSLGTMHRAKGLEFKCVFVIDASDNYLPSAAVLSKKTDAQLREDFIEQERQLLYVSITRARDAAFVTWAGKPSRFLQGKGSRERIAMAFAVGSLVKARGREWVVLPESAEDLLVLRPLGGTEDEVTGIYLPLEPVEPATFALPDPSQPGDYRSCRLLRDAVRLGFRSSAGPFRAFARIAVEPRPYQLVPLLLALRLDPVRLLIADDVGIGKTIEACLIARELLDRGEIERLAVLCSPQLAPQWQNELRDKFHIEAEIVLPGTVTRLERNCRLNQSIFDLYPHVIVSTDFIKADRRRDEFLRACPELVIVDEAHTCAYGYDNRGGRHQRYQLVSQLAAHPERHVILVTATPHSGNEAAFRSLLGLLHPDFASLPEDLSGERTSRTAAVWRRISCSVAAPTFGVTSIPTRSFPSAKEAEDTLPAVVRLQTPL